MHIHVQSPEGELKVWLERRIELAENHGILFVPFKRVPERDPLRFNPSKASAG